MLNISNISIEKNIRKSEFMSFQKVKNKHSYRRLFKIIMGVFLFLILCLFLPWTQYVRSTGVVNSLKPEQRPQTIVANISGRLDKWYVSEGQLVHKGDTIIALSEIKSEYLDPDQLQRVQEQIDAKKESIVSYEEKLNALKEQKNALQSSLALKLQQAKNKVQQANLSVKSDSISTAAAKVYLDNITDLLERNEQLFYNDEGPLISKTKWQSIVSKEQDARAKYIGKQNKYETSINKFINSQIELMSINANYSEKLAKILSTRSSAASMLADAKSSLSKLKNKQGNYTVRNEYRMIKAPQDGYITKALKSGIGIVIKEGEGIVTIMPKDHDLAVEMYVSPIDLPLMGIDHEVNLIFDGWPVIAVPGWPEAASYGTFRGKIVAIDNMISSKGKYRILVSPSDESKPWPVVLRLGSGVKAYALLNDVPLYRELWRKMNGFPADFYDEHKHDHIVKHRIEKTKSKK